LPLEDRRAQLAIDLPGEVTPADKAHVHFHEPSVAVNWTGSIGRNWLSKP
jgi:hypothetical protein